MKKNRKEFKAEFYKPEAISNEIGNFDLIPNEYVFAIAESVSLLPCKVIDFVMENLAIIAGGSEEMGCYFSFDDIQFEGKNGLIILQSRLFEKNSIGISFTIAHEIAHAWNGDGVNDIKKTEMNEGIKREINADKQAIKWLSKHFKVEDLKKCCGYFGNKKLEKKLKSSM